MKKIFAPHLNRNVIVGGRRRPNPHTLKLSFGRYAAKLPAPPSYCDYTPKALAVLRQMYGNDVLGDCVIAGGYHTEGLITGNSSTAFVATNAQITADYSAIGGYNPKDPNTDQGCDEQTALNYWQKKGFANGSKLTAWLAVDASNKTQVQQAMWLFENLFFGVELPDSWISPFPSKDGFVWDISKAGPDVNNGHAFVGVGFNDKGVQVATWALLGTVTWGSLVYATPSKGGELYVLLTQDIIDKAKGKSPAGFDWATLVSDFNAFGGIVPNPSPTPAATLVSIATTPSYWGPIVTAAQAFTVKGTYSDGTVKDLSSVSSWTSSNPKVATITSSGQAVAVAVGTTTFVVKTNGLTASVTANVVAIPTPSTGVTLAQAQKWASDGLAASWPKGR